MTIKTYYAIASIRDNFKNFQLYRFTNRDRDIAFI